MLYPLKETCDVAVFWGRIPVAHFGRVPRCLMLYPLEEHCGVVAFGGRMRKPCCVAALGGRIPAAA